MRDGPQGRSHLRHAQPSRGGRKAIFTILKLVADSGSGENGSRNSAHGWRAATNVCMRHYMKNWKSIDDQLGLLKSRGMAISEPIRAKKALERFGYYRLSGYWYPFK
jgi:hypothetical protein